MKFLAVALCVCAAISASFGSGRHRSYKNVHGLSNVAAPAVVAAKAVPAVTAPVATPFAVATAATYQAGSATYQAGSNTYQAAKQVVNKAYSSNDGQATILRSESNVSPSGFRYGYKTQNGISAESTGTYKQVGDVGSFVFQGFYRYTAPDGTPVHVTYIADENGYRAQGDVLPVGPAVPEAILRSLAFIAARSKDTAQKY